MQLNDNFEMMGQGKRIKIAYGMSLSHREDISIKRHLVSIGRSWLYDPATEGTCIG
jgi:hypothetical protein